MKTGDALGHPLFLVPVMLFGIMVLIQTLHTVTHWHMQIDADAWCRNNAEWVERNEGDDY